jgi:hypothetical protein
MLKGSKPLSLKDQLNFLRDPQDKAVKARAPSVSSFAKFIRRKSEHNGTFQSMPFTIHQQYCAEPGLTHSKFLAKLLLNMFDFTSL